MGLSSSFLSMVRIIGPIWAGLLFDLNISYPYLSGSLFMLIGFVIRLVWVRREDGGVERSLSGISLR